MRLFKQKVIDPTTLISLCLSSSRRTTVFLWATSVLFLQLPVEGGTVRASFLDEPAALRETLAILRDNGCTHDVVIGFERAVNRYNTAPLQSDLSRFPQPRDGLYAFDSVARLVAALPHKLCDTRHAYDLNCFDTVIMLASDRLRTGLRADEIFGPFLVPHTPTNRAFMILPAATARDAFALAYPSWYRENTESIFSGSIGDARICLTAGLFRCHVLPMSTTDDRLGAGVINALRASWKAQKIEFPSAFEIVLCHEVSLPQRMFATAHAGLLIPREKSWTYVEKAGGTGPFVRLDLDDRSDLTPWLAAIFTGAAKLGYTHHFATFNDGRIEMLKIPK